MKKIVAAVATLSAAGSSFAAGGIDTTGVTTALTDAGTAAGTVGAAVLVVIVGIKAYGLIKKAL